MPFRPGMLTPYLLLLMVGCAGINRSCAAECATNLGSDWVVVQMDMDGRPFRCWELHGASITNESQSDGIYWEDTESRNLVHISGHYNRVQVTGGGWDRAYAAIGLTKATCAAVHAAQYDPSTRSFK